MKNEKRQNEKQNSGGVYKKGILTSFSTPIKGILDIILIMAITTIAVAYFGPIIIRATIDDCNEYEKQLFNCDYTCSETGRLVKDYLVDEHGEIYGWIDIEYHDNGSLKRVTEHNRRDNTEIRVYYSEENEFLYWYEIKYDEDGNEISLVKYGAEGSQIN